MSLSRQEQTQIRVGIQELLSAENPVLRDNPGLRDEVLIPIDQFSQTFPVDIGDFTDFYSSKTHAFNVGSKIRGPDKALNPNWVWMPVAYNGRASSIHVSGDSVPRPRG